MKTQDVITFRSICKQLIEEQSKTLGFIIGSSGLNNITLDKILKEDVQSMHMHASTLAKIQDFNKRNIHILHNLSQTGFSHISDDVVSEFSIQSRNKVLKSSLVVAKKEESTESILQDMRNAFDKVHTAEVEEHQYQQVKEKDISLKVNQDLIEFITQFQNNLPKGVEVHLIFKK